MAGGEWPAAHLLEKTPLGPPEVRPAAMKLLLNGLDGVGAGMMEREATKSRCPRLGTVPIVRA